MLNRKIFLPLLLLLISFRKVFIKKQYYIKKGYVHRKYYKYYDDTGLTYQYQKEIYETAKDILLKNNYKRVIDIGCGSGAKLVGLFGSYEIIGVDVPDTVNYLKSNYPAHRWLSVEDFNTSEYSADMVICSDVIEHVLNPLDILNTIKSINEVKYIVLSTPERDILNGCLDFGPPKNPTHIREWNGWEFQRFIRDHFNIISHSVTNFAQGTQMLVCTPKKD